MNIDFSYYFSIFLRRFPYFVLVAAFFTAAGVTVAMVLPAEYEASATMLVESPQIPDELAASTVQTVTNEQLQIIEQRLLTRANLIDTAARLNVFENASAMTATQVVDAMRARTKFVATSGRGQATFFTVSFRGASPSLVAQVANEFVTLILDENVRMRTGLAGGTLEFFEDEVQRLSSELDAQGAEILKFQTENANALPENRDFLASRQTQIVDKMRELTRQIEGYEAQKVKAIELFEATGAVGGQRSISPEQQAFNQAQAALDEALLVFAPNNPRINVLRARMEQAKARLEASLAETDGETVNPERSAARLVLDTQIADIDRQVDELNRQRDQLQVELDAIEESLSVIPSNSVVMDSLQRDYANTQQQYQKAQERLAQAATGERIELLSKGQRIIVLEQATAPEKPTKPDRALIAIAGLGAGVSLGLGFVLILELLNRSVRRPIEISDKLGITPFGVLPYIRTDQETRWRQTLIIAVLLIAVIGVPLILWSFHNYVAPLDSYLEKFLNRFGMTLS